MCYNVGVTTLEEGIVMDVIRKIFKKTEIPEDLRSHCESEKNRLNQTMFGFLAPFVICFMYGVTLIFVYLMFQNKFDIKYILFVTFDSIYVLFLSICYFILKVHKSQHRKKFKPLMNVIYFVSMLWAMSLSILDNHATVYIIGLLLFATVFIMEIKPVIIIQLITLSFSLVMFTVLKLDGQLLLSLYINILFANLISFFISNIGYRINIENFISKKIIEKQNFDLKVMVETDMLTGIYNRRFFVQSFERLIKTLSRSKSMFSLLMVDIDFFKKFNDTYGHDQGDKCLRAVAQEMPKSVMRAGDFIARYGEEEFVAILPGTDEAGAHVVAENLLANISALDIPHSGSTAAPYVTVSIGVTTGTVGYGHKWEVFVKRADDALYKSKQNGRNQYTFLER